MVFPTRTIMYRVPEFNIEVWNGWRGVKEEVLCETLRLSV